MQKLLIILLAVLGLSGAIFLVTTQSGGPSGVIETYYGEPQALGDGATYAWIQLDGADHLVAIGINIDEAAIASLPTDEPVYQFSMAFPPQAAGIPFRHALLDWAPSGHEPPGVYDLPHFDAHFYVTEESERLMIGAEDAEHDVEPDHSHLPADYEKIPGGIPAMGAHWYDPASPEFNGKTFTETLIFGSYNGEVTFLEPMFTLAYLQTQPNLTKEIPLPAEYEPAWSLFPKFYSIKYDRSLGEYSISLHGFEEHTH